MGVDLNRVTILVGAFGVGIGFGLQTVVNNFVSGLILLVERSIQVGDTVQIGDLVGRGPAHRHPLQHGAHLGRRRGHRPQRPSSPRRS